MTTYEWTPHLVSPSIGPTRTEAAVELVARRCGVQDELGKKGETGILKSKQTHRAFREDPSHRIRFVYNRTLQPVCRTVDPTFHPTVAIVVGERHEFRGGYHAITMAICD